MPDLRVTFTRDEIADLLKNYVNTAYSIDREYMEVHFNIETKSSPYLGDTYRGDAYLDEAILTVK